MTRMFRVIEATFNPVVGCTHNCVYCWARRQAKRQRHRCKLCYDFIPHTHFHRKLPYARRVFLVDMGDLFCEAVPDEWITQTINLTNQRPETTFLFCTKNPLRYHNFVDLFPKNCVLGVTLETNRDQLSQKYTYAPPPSKRYEAMKNLPFPRKFISNEPLLDFDLHTLLKWISDINPETCEIGYDNYNYYLPEPPLQKTLKLIQEKTNLGINTYQKQIRPAWYEVGTHD